MEAGQIVIVIILFVLAKIVQYLLKVNHREWMIFLSAAVFSLALKVALDRFPT